MVLESSGYGVGLRLWMTMAEGDAMDFPLDQGRLKCGWCALVSVSIQCQNSVSEVSVQC
jgi:hypothetical protein